jgi:hypothetical protein
MSPNTVFALANLAVLPAWVALILAPSWKWTRVVAAYVTPATLALAWAGVMAGRFAPTGGGFGSLEQLSSLTRDPWILVGVWLHNLMLDLFLGSWATRDAQRLGVRHAYVIPCLIATFFAGPIGLLSYFVVRILVVRKMPWRS